MSIRFCAGDGVLVVAGIVLMAGHCWAIFYRLRSLRGRLGVEIRRRGQDADGDTLTVVFTLADEGR